MLPKTFVSDFGASLAFNKKDCIDHENHSMNDISNKDIKWLTKYWSIYFLLIFLFPLFTVMTLTLILSICLYDVILNQAVQDYVSINK